MEMEYNEVSNIDDIPIQQKIKEHIITKYSIVWLLSS